MQLRSRIKKLERLLTPAPKTEIFVFETRAEFEAQQKAHLEEYGEIPKHIIYIKDIDGATGKFIMDLDDDEMMDGSSPDQGY